MSVPMLPFELLDLIFALIADDQSTLLRVRLVCHTWGSVATAHCFRSVTSEHSDHASRLVALFHQSPSIASLVQTIVIHPLKHIYEMNYECPSSLLRDIVLPLPNLRSITLYDCARPFVPHDTTVLMPITHPYGAPPPYEQIRQLTLHKCLFRTYDNMDEFLCSFPGLSDLALDEIVIRDPSAFERLLLNDGHAVRTDIRIMCLTNLVVLPREHKNLDAVIVEWALRRVDLQHLLRLTIGRTVNRTLPSVACLLARLSNMGNLRTLCLSPDITLDDDHHGSLPPAQQYLGRISWPPRAVVRDMLDLSGFAALRRFEYRVDRGCAAHCASRLLPPLLDTLSSARLETLVFELATVHDAGMFPFATVDQFVGRRNIQVVFCANEYPMYQAKLLGVLRKHVETSMPICTAKKCVQVLSMKI